MPEGVTFQTLDDMTRALGQLTGPGLEAVSQRSSLQIGHELINRLQRYPTRKSDKVVWASRKQQMWYHAMRREAGLDLRYKRISDPMSQKLRQSWGSQKYGRTGAIIGNRATYAHFVQSQELQQPMHEATGWETDVDAVEYLEKRNLIPRIVVGNIDKYVKRVMRGMGG